MTGYSRREINDAEMNNRRIRALENRDPAEFYRLCNQLGVEPESEDLYAQGEIIVENLSIKEAPEGGLEKEIRSKRLEKKKRGEKPLTENDIQFMRDYESGRFSDGYLLRLHFEKFRRGEIQDLNRYGEHQIRLIAKNVYNGYKAKEDKNRSR